MRWIVVVLLALVGCGSPESVFTTGSGTSSGSGSTGGTGGNGGTATAGTAGSAGSVGGSAGTSGGSAGSASTGGSAGSGPVTCDDGVCEDVLAGQCFTSYVCSAGGLCNGVDLIPGKDDGDACTHDVCNGSGWNHTPVTVAEVNDGDPCTDDSCSSVNGITHTPIPNCFPPINCETYCANIADNCIGPDSQYTDHDSCAGICALIPTGMPQDVSGNSAYCRLYHSGDPAKSVPQAECPKAGPLGGGVCGDACADFCQLAVAICGSQPTPPYADLASCMTTCATYAGIETVPYNSTVTSGNSLACRMYHLTIAASNPGLAPAHCQFAGSNSLPCQ